MKPRSDRRPDPDPANALVAFVEVWAGWILGPYWLLHMTWRWWRAR
jgi:hypothetical protein